MAGHWKPCGSRLGREGRYVDGLNPEGSPPRQKGRQLPRSEQNRKLLKTILLALPLNEDAMAALVRLRERAEALGCAEPGHYVFPACENGQIDPTRHQKTWRTAWRNLTIAAGLKGYRFHDLRHQAITELAEAGAPDATLMVIAGHLSREMIEHYSHVQMQAKREAVEKLSSGFASETTEESESVAKVN